MDQQLKAMSDQDRWNFSEQEFENRVGGILDSAEFHSPLDRWLVETEMAAARIRKLDEPVSSVMEKSLWAVSAIDTVAKVEEMLFTLSTSSVPVIGSNGVIVGIIGPQELTQFLLDGKNAKATRAWEISRCTLFEVNPDESVETVAKLMVENKLDYIAVTEQGVLKGVVSMPDLMQVVLNEKMDDPLVADEN
ncbi:MAG TPA: CBS domain-containing protein [Burkholderiaceae bacterium]|nr:CBS domain-containing protein [Burkholderiaceae bacterium]